MQNNPTLERLIRKEEERTDRTQRLEVSPNMRDAISHTQGKIKEAFANEKRVPVSLKHYPH